MINILFQTLLTTYKVGKRVTLYFFFTVRTRDWFNFKTKGLVVNERENLSFIGNLKRSVLVMLIFFFVLVSSIDSNQGIQVKIGVLAFRGAEESLEKWTPIAEYLTTKISEYTFIVVPLGYDEIFEAVENDEIDFVLGNSSIYVELEHLFGVDRIATLKYLCQGQAYDQFGGVIFTSKNRKDINNIGDLKNKSFMAVHEISFGGWRMAQREFKDYGINPYRDFADIQFGGTQDKVVYAVQKGQIDAGTVRTGILESMDEEGKIDIKDFTILNQQHPDNFLLLLSTRLYPEWPIAKVKHTSERLSQQVSIALLSMLFDDKAIRDADIVGWTIPHHYQLVHECLKELRVRPYEDIGKITLANLIQQYWGWILAGFIGVIVLTVFMIFVVRLNRKLNISTFQLEESHNILEQKVEERTSELKQSNQQLIKENKARKRAEEKQERLILAIEQADETVVITDIEGNIEYVNPAFEKITGYTAQEVMGQNPRVLKSDQHDDAFYRKMWETLSSGKQWHGEIINKKKDGSLYTENAVISPVFDSSGKIINYVAAKNDITETKRLQELELRAGRLEMAGTIAGQVAHDFNNLLAPIMAYPEFIREELPHDHKAQAYLDTIEKAAIKIANINQDLLTMGRRGHYTQDVININKIILLAIKEMEARIETVTCETDLCQNIMKIKGGSAQIHRMLTNLLVNAQDAMQNIGKIVIRTENFYADDTSIVFGRVPKGEYVKVTISDNGCGIPDNIIQKILDPFFSTKIADKKRGSGLGLSVVDAVIKDHNGFLDMKSKIGQGTSFYLYFPVTRENITEKEAEHVKGNNETVLVVDDDDMLREVSTKLLTKLGYIVHSVESGEKAVEFLRENPQDIVMLDMVMPGGIDGTETYRQMREINSNQKAIIVSGFSESDRVFEAQRLGVGAFIKKPFTKATIAGAVRTELDREVKIVNS